ncbi:MAG: hypothetical protein JJT89_15700 [Nitriliruptoraceae bacterium]|nr:hypothetical protein [Nitriliruptoraceae bacterium]
MTSSRRSLLVRASLVACSLTLLAVACSGGSSLPSGADGSDGIPADEPTPDAGTDPDEVDPDPDVGDDPGPAEPDPTEPPDPADDAAAALPPAPDPAPLFELSADEVLPNAKRLASDIVQSLLTYEPDTTAEDLAATVATGPLTTQVAGALGPIHHTGSWSRGEIVYPQLGGATATDTSVMVVAEQTIGSPDGQVRTERRTFDVRLTIADEVWVLDEVASVGGVPVPRPDDLSVAARAVLDDPRIELPDSAVWDIHAGITAESLLRLMAQMAEHTPYGVIVLETGHPFNVFGTDRVSRHMAGLAVDLYRLDGPLVIDDREQGGETHAFVEWLYERDDVRVIGSPWALDGFGGRSFTDLVHQDHLHIESVPTRAELEAAAARGALRSDDPDPRELGADDPQPGE